MKCGTCKTEMADNTERFNSTEQHLLGPGWTHLICKNEKCSELGNGKHVKTEEYMRMQTIPTRPVMEPLAPAKKSNKIKGAKILPGKPLPPDAEEKLLKMKETQDNIDMLNECVTELYQDEELTKIQEKIFALQSKFEEKKKELGITDTEIAINDEIEIQRNMIASFGPSLAMDLWGPDAFSKGKKDAVTSADGKIFLLRSKTTKRKIIPTEFIKYHPLVLNELLEENKLTITLKEAETKIGKEDIDTVCEKTTTYSYEFVVKDGRNIPTGGK